MSDPNIARYTKLLHKGGYYDAWMLMLEDVEEAGDDPDAPGRLLDAFAAAQGLAAEPGYARTVSPSLYWRLIAEGEPDAAVQTSPTKLRPVMRKKHEPMQPRKPYLRVVGDY